MSDLDQLYAVNAIYPTLQGEGVMTGVPMVLLRMQGCSVGCSFCDTKETWKLPDAGNRVETIDDIETSPHSYALLPAKIIAEKAVSFGVDWVMLTGGEPSERPLGAIVRALHDVGLKVALETSGTVRGHIGAGFDWVCVSPKIGMAGGKNITLDAIIVADEMKFVVGKQSDIDILNTLLREIAVFGNNKNRKMEICVQPISQSTKATAICVEQAVKNNWRLSLQTHKYINLK